MFAEMPLASLYLMLVGGFATALGMAALRREWSWVLALGLPLLLAAERAGVPAEIFAWGCAFYAIALVVLAGAWMARTLGLVGVGLAGAVLLGGFSSMPAAASLGDFTALSLHRPPALGIRLAAMLDALAEDPRVAAD